MLLKNYVAIARISFLVSLLGLLTACSGNGNIENLFATDPKLKQNPSTPTPTATPQPTQAPQTQDRLPEDFPSDIPRYPQAELVSSEPGKTIWRSPDPSNSIAAFYQEQFQSQNWQIVTPFNTDGGAENRLVARQSDLEVAVAIASSSTNNTEFTIEYQRPNNAAQQQPESQENQIASQTPVEFSDLNDVPEPLQQTVKDLAQLGILTANPVDSDRFNPNATIKRREYARWLVAANNKFYANQPGKQIRLGEQSSEPIFKDVPKNDPDFAVIQGLAEAGLIPSALTNDNSAALFRPNAPLTREEMISWKAPLDNRKALPTTSIDGIKESWGFQDASKIDTKALRSLYSDYQNGDQANIRRVYGYTTLFQPNKPVTRAEAAASLGYFGFQGDGISVQDALKIQEEGTG